VKGVVLFSSVSLLAVMAAAECVAQGELRERAEAVVDADGTVHVPKMDVPLSRLASEEAKRNFESFVEGFNSLEGVAGEGEDIDALRKFIDDRLMRPGVEKLRHVFAVEIAPTKIGGVQTDVINPVGGYGKRNGRRVLINLHGGSFEVGARLGGQMESIPIASLGKIRVITVDYREGPENRFPAASEDVAAVYRQLLKEYPAKNIGIYGCSSGATLTAEAVAWFQTHGLPVPGAIGIFGGGAFVPESAGDSTYIGSALVGWAVPPPNASDTVSYFDVPALDTKEPLVSPVYWPKVLAHFPPTLLLTGTRDIGLSPVVYTHAQLIHSGVEAELHVWEGAPHCSYAQPVVDPEVPETREAWNAITQFFDRHLGR